MPRDSARMCRAGRLRDIIRFFNVLRVALLLSAVIPQRAAAETITNLAQLVRTMDAEPRVVSDIHLNVTVCAASRPEIGVVVARDATGAELLELGPRAQAILPGDKIRIDGQRCLLRRRDLGVKLSAVPVVDNDGIHIQTNRTGEVTLTAGRHPLELDWFNQFRDFVLDVTCQRPNAAPEQIPIAWLWRTAANAAAGAAVFRPGLRVESYEGLWENVPDFELLRPVKTGIATNFDLQFRTQDEMVGLRFTGFFDAPAAGKYVFSTRSDDGSLLFIGDPEVNVSKLGVTPVPAARSAIIGEPMTSLDERRWLSMEGRINFVYPAGKGLELELRSERDSLRVKIADATGLDPAALLNAHVRVTGVGRGVFNLDQRIVLGQLVVASANNLEFLGALRRATALPSPLVTAQQVQTLHLEDARRSLPVRLRGVVTSIGPPYDYWLSIQDDTRGIFVDTHVLSNAPPDSIPAGGEYWEIIGHSGAGDFAPIVVADRATRLGGGRLPEPARPAWNELINGSMDVQWVEFQGLVTDVHSNTLALLLPGGQLAVQMEGYYESELKQYEKSVVRIRGVLFAAWNSGTRELRVGTILMRNARVSVDIPAPADPFDAVLKTPRQLLLFDAQATAFRRVKVRGQIIYADPSRIFLMEGGAGLRILPAGAVDRHDLHPGDLAEAVGYPEISGMSPLLREAIVRKTGKAALPPARMLTDNALTAEGLDATRVRVEGKLLGWHMEQGAPVLEMQSGGHLYLARLAPETSVNLSLHPGSRLALDGVYVGQGRSNQRPGAEPESFELLLNSPADITVLSQPSWWTLQRLLIIVGILLVGLVFALMWITQLRRLVEQRTAQLQRETRERERVERRHALEAERSRIARDLHDDLGSSLTEIGVLASTGLRRADRPDPSDAPHETSEGEVAGATETAPATPQANQRRNGGESGAAALFRAIASKARGLIAALDVIVWAVDPEDNSLQSLADYLSGFAGEYLSHSGITCRFKVPVTFPPVTLDGRVRHDLLMVVKETLNNIVRHADATEVEFRMAVEDHSLDIAIADNGKGFEGAGGRDGHGLKNLSARLTRLGGICHVASRTGGGTTVNIRLPLPIPAGTGTSPAGNGNTTFG
jgi:signal transduction histidine kinase